MRWRPENAGEAISLVADTLVVLAASLGLIYAIFPGVRSFLEQKLSRSAYYYLGEVSENGTGNELSYHQFYSTSWTEDGAPRVYGDDKQLSIWDSIRQIENQIVFVDPPTADEPVPGRRYADPSEIAVSIAKPGECYFVRNLICRIRGEKDGLPQLFVDNGCHRTEELLSDVNDPEFASIWINATRLTCS